MRLFNREPTSQIAKPVPGEVRPPRTADGEEVERLACVTQGLEHRPLAAKREVDDNAPAGLRRERDDTDEGKPEEDRHEPHGLSS